MDFLEEKSNPKIGCFKVLRFGKVYCAFTVPQARNRTKIQALQRDLLSIAIGSQDFSKQEGQCPQRKATYIPELLVGKLPSRENRILLNEQAS